MYLPHFWPNFFFYQTQSRRQSVLVYAKKCRKLLPAGWTNQIKNFGVSSGHMGDCQYSSIKIICYGEVRNIARHVDPFSFHFPSGFDLSVSSPRAAHRALRPQHIHEAVGRDVIISHCNTLKGDSGCQQQTFVDCIIVVPLPARYFLGRETETRQIWLAAMVI